jgi:hypothetical protein
MRKNDIIKLLDIIIRINDDKILDIYQSAWNISWSIIIKKLENNYKYNKIIKLIVNKNLIMNLLLIDNELFKKVILSYDDTNLVVLDYLIINKLNDKIQIYVENINITSAIIEHLLEKYNKYNLYYFLIKITIITEKMIFLIVKNKNNDYLKLIKEKCNINEILKYSILYNYQYGIDMALNNSANYISVLNEIHNV